VKSSFNDLVKVGPNPKRVIATGPEILVARFALPCGWDKFRSMIVTESDWFWLLKLALSVDYDNRLADSDHNRLARLFPHLVGSWQERDWSYEEVLDKLRRHDGKHGECHAKHLVIYCDDGARESPITGHNHQVFAGLSEGGAVHSPLFDLYDLNPAHDSMVLVHKSVIILII
jgi:hypothetical protein